MVRGKSRWAAAGGGDRCSLGLVPLVEADQTVVSDLFSFLLFHAAFLLPGVSLLVTARGHRANMGRCPLCGYDRRQSPTRCPECGTTAPPPDLGDVGATCRRLKRAGWLVVMVPLGLDAAILASFVWEVPLAY